MGLGGLVFHFFLQNAMGWVNARHPKTLLMAGKCCWQHGAGAEISRVN